MPICLIQPELVVKIFEINKGTVIGYGRSENEPVLYEKIPRRIELPIHDSLYCLERFPNLAFMTSRRTFCAGNATETGACNGDSGSGFYTKYQGRFYFRGIVSSSAITGQYECGLDQFTIFTNLLSFTDWMTNEIDLF